MTKETEAIVLKDNNLRETCQPLARIGIRLGPQTRAITLHDNRTEGFARPVMDMQQP